MVEEISDIDRFEFDNMFVMFELTNTIKDREAIEKIENIILIYKTILSAKQSASQDDVDDVDDVPVVPVNISLANYNSKDIQFFQNKYRSITLKFFSKYKQYYYCDIISELTKKNLDDLIKDMDKDSIPPTSGGNAKVTKINKKEILGRERCIYKKAGDRKEYLKHKG